MKLLAEIDYVLKEAQSKEAKLTAIENGLEAKFKNSNQSKWRRYNESVKKMMIEESNAKESRVNKNSLLNLEEEKKNKNERKEYQKKKRRDSSSEERVSEINQRE